MMYVYFWGFLIVYGIVLLALSPKAVSFDSFFHGKDEKGNNSSTLMITSSIFISWIFAKSVTNAANLGAKYGIIGGIAYATYWLCIPIAGFVIYRLRTKFKAKGLVSFLNENYGQKASLFFTAAIFIRLFNEVWSNTTVVGGYYGVSGSASFIGAAIFFTIVTLIYSVRGGLRSSIFTDLVQTLIFIVFMIIIVSIVLPKAPLGNYVNSSTWSLGTGLDLLLVTVIQIFSYPFHDPVLTDRGFISDEKVMLRAYIISGLLGFLSILLFSFIGIYAKMEGMPITDNIPVAVGMALGPVTLFVMTIVMVVAAGSTLDSAFSSLAKLAAVDLPEIAGKKIDPDKARHWGMAIMVIFAIVGNIPMFTGTNILKATTISGTMVMGFAPIFCLHGIVKPTKLGFNLSFWIGIVLGILFTLNMIPDFFAIGTGDSALLLGVNLYGTILCIFGYILPSFFVKKEGRI
ncbi:SLC5/6 family protein [Peptostreptococcus faecalis]|uniref:sodium:solute symporter n=1 Tax=Peptostreptococcus faecalis TaxID=2045015 RepID=UPI000C7BFC8E|nr:sodium:solute symporter [Peptostreptococcus faecalis]